MPYLVLLVQVDLDLLLVPVRLASMELSPDKSSTKLIALSRYLLDRALSIYLLLGLLRRRHRDSVS